MRRRFVCSAGDLDKFRKLFYDTLSKLNPNDKCRYIAFYLSQREKEMSKLGLKHDELTQEFVSKALETFDITDFHYAIHHQVYQMWDAARNGSIRVSRKKMKWLAKVTKDCLE
jgi:hypothetical protein